MSIVLGMRFCFNVQYFPSPIKNIDSRHQSVGNTRQPLYTFWRILFYEWLSRKLSTNLHFQNLMLYMSSVIDIHCFLTAPLLQSLRLSFPGGNKSMFEILANPLNVVLWEYCFGECSSSRKFSANMHFSRLGLKMSCYCHRLSLTLALVWTKFRRVLEVTMSNVKRFCMENPFVILLNWVLYFLIKYSLTIRKTSTSNNEILYHYL